MISNVAARKVEFQIAAMYHRFSSRLKIWCISNVSAKYAVYKNYRYQIYPQVDPNLVYSQYTCCLDDPEILTRYHRLRPESVAGIERNMQVFQSL